MAQEKRHGRGAAPAPAEVQTAVRKKLDRDGERAVCQALQLSRLSVTKLAAGLPVYPGTVALAIARLGIDA